MNKSGYSTVYLTHIKFLMSSLIDIKLEEFSAFLSKKIKFFFLNLYLLICLSHWEEGHSGVHSWVSNKRHAIQVPPSEGIGRT